MNVKYWGYRTDGSSVVKLFPIPFLWPSEKREDYKCVIYVPFKEATVSWGKYRFSLCLGDII